MYVYGPPQVRSGQAERQDKTREGIHIFQQVLRTAQVTHDPNSSNTPAPPDQCSYKCEENIQHRSRSVRVLGLMMQARQIKAGRIRTGQVQLPSSDTDRTSQEGTSKTCKASHGRSNQDRSGQVTRSKLNRQVQKGQAER